MKLTIEITDILYDALTTAQTIFDSINTDDDEEDKAMTKQKKAYDKLINKITIKKYNPIEIKGELKWV